MFGLIDINGDALHASMGLPPALNVATAKVGKLEIIVSFYFYFRGGGGILDLRTDDYLG